MLRAFVASEPVKLPVENQWNSSGKLVGRMKNWRDVVFIWLPRRRTRSVLACGYGPVLHDPQSGF